MHVFPTSPNPQSNFNAKKGGKLYGNTLSPVDILHNVTLLGTAQSLFSVVWPLLNFSWLGKAAYSLGMHWKKHIWGYISVKGLQKERRSKILYLVSYTSGKCVKALWSHECLLGFLWVVCWSDLWEEYMWWGKSGIGRGLDCVLGTLEWSAAVRVERCGTQQGTPISPPVGLPGLCRQRWLVLSLSHPGKANCMRFLKDFFFISKEGVFFKLFCYLKWKILLILPTLVIFPAILVILGASQHPKSSGFYPPHRTSVWANVTCVF